MLCMLAHIISKAVLFLSEANMPYLNQISCSCYDCVCVRWSHLQDEWCVVWFVVINGNADGARHQGIYENSDDANVWYSILQTGEALAEDIKQQRHQTQSCNTGASGHYDAGRVTGRKETVLDICV